MTVESNLVASALALAESNISVKIGVGLSVMANCLDFHKPELIGPILTGQFDDEILAAVYFCHHKVQPQNSEHRTCEVARSDLVKIKDHIRATVVDLLSYHNELLEQMPRMSRKPAEVPAEVKRDLQKSHAPHAQGTVAEIAAKFGLSKSEVRRRKAEGTLDELFK